MISQARNTSKKRVSVGLSGGVDSAVSAALLKRAGYDVTGVFIKVWQPDWIECTWRDDRREAMRVAAHLNIPFVTLDLEKEYKHDVIDYMIAEYGKGRTPNPDVMCNRYVKFGAFWQWAREQGADFIATGHYARIKIQHSPAGEYFTLLTGNDSNKDQSYFLWTLNQHDLPHVLFPVGDLPKPEVRKLARQFRLPNATRKDSQGLCFIGKVDVKEFLSHYIKAEPGKVLNEQGEIIGTHPGSLFFTIGERHGFSISDNKKTPNDAAYYIIEKDAEQNTITVSNRDNKEASTNSASKQVRIGNINWVRGRVPENNSLQARSRYRQPLEDIRILSMNITEAVLEFEKPQSTLTPGQSLVLYDGEECIGGGIIEE
jgi:tRNA-specific 2-thiouridylase